MDFSRMQDYQYFVKLGTVTVVSSLLTLLLTAIVKIVLKRKGIVYEGMDEVRKDKILSETARWVAFVCYSALYVGSQYINGKTLSFDGSFLVGILSGGALTLAVSKAVYTAVHQFGLRMEKSRNENEEEKERMANTKGETVKAENVRTGGNDETKADEVKTRSWKLGSK